MNALQERRRALGQHRPHAPALITPMLIGAAVGAVSAAVTGGNILKGALFGAIGGGISSALSGAFGAAASSTASGVGSAASSGVGAAAGGVVEGAAGAMLPGLETAAVSGAANLPGLEMGLSSMGDVAASTVGSGMQMAGPAGAPGSTGIGGPNFSTGFTDGGTAGGALDTSFAGTSGGTSFMDGLLNKGKDMLNSRMATGMIGNVLQGHGQQKQQEAAFAQRRQLIAEERANARYGNMGSRYNAGGMVTAPATYK